MKIIVVSPEKNVKNEAAIVEALFLRGLTNFHLRKPDFTEEQVIIYLKQISPEFHNSIILHSHHHLSERYNVKGFHYTAKMRTLMPKLDNRLHNSTSFHELDELKHNKLPYTYVFLSPIFPSISKLGYEKQFPQDKVRKALDSTTIKVVALGGIDVDKLDEVKEMGFAGAAILGAIWNEPDPLAKFEFIKKKADAL